jgi:YHS domain-containing protein
MEDTVNPPQSSIDPVCAMKVNPGQTEHRYTYKNHIYFFCADACRNTFRAEPEKYLKGSPVKRKGIWGRYLDRLNKATGGRSQQCH